MRTNKKAVNARKAGLHKEKAKKELLEFLDDFLEFFPPEHVDENLFTLLNVASTSAEFDMFEKAEIANLLCMLDDITYLMYLIRDAYEYEKGIIKTEKAAV